MRMSSGNSRARPSEVDHRHVGHTLFGKKADKAFVHGPVGQVLRHTKAARVSTTMPPSLAHDGCGLLETRQGVQGTKPLLSLWPMYQPDSQCLYCKPACPRWSLSMWKRRTAWRGFCHSVPTHCQDPRVSMPQNVRARLGGRRTPPSCVLAARWLRRRIRHR